MPRPNPPEPSYDPRPRHFRPWALIGAVTVLALALQSVRVHDGRLAAAPAADVLDTHLYLPHLFSLRPVPSPGPSPVPTQAVATGRVAEIAQRGDRVYAIVGAEIVVIAITDVRRPAIVGRVPAEGTPYDLAVAASRLVLLREGYVDTYDLTDPDRPRLVGSTKVWGRPYYAPLILDAYQDHALISTPCYPLTVLDVRGPAPARVIAHAPAAGLLTAIVGHVAILRHGDCYPGDTPGGLGTVDLRDPAQPRAIGKLPPAEWPHRDILQIIGARNTSFGAMFRHDGGISAVLLAASEDGTLRQTDGTPAGGFKRAVTDSTGHLYVTYESEGQSQTKAVSLGGGATPVWTIVGSLATPPRTVATASLGLVVTLDAKRGTLTAIDYRDVADPVLGADLLIPGAP